MRNKCNQWNDNNQPIQLNVTRMCKPMAVKNSTIKVKPGLRKQTTFRGATTGVPAGKQRLGPQKRRLFSRAKWSKRSILSLLTAFIMWIPIYFARD